MGFWVSRNRLVINVGAELALESETAQGLTAVFPIKVAVGRALESEDGALATPSLDAGGTLGDPPGLSTYEAYMLDEGVTAANQAIDQSEDPNETQYGQQYDGVNVMRFIRRHTGVTEPYRSAEVYIRDGYINNYIVGNDYKPQGHLQYPMGLYYNYVEHAHQPSIDAIDGWSEALNWTWHNDDNRRHQVFSREIAYGTLSLVMLEDALGVGNTNLTANGLDVPDRFPFMMTCMENHLYQWRFRDFSDPFFSSHPYIDGARADYMNPFMVALTCYTLAKYYDHNESVRSNGNLNWPTTNWADIPTAIEDILTWMMDTALVADGDQAGERIWYIGGDTWLDGPSGSGTFAYIDRDASGIGGPSAAPDLNMVIVTAYAWVAKHKGGAAGRAFMTDRADKLFYGGASQINSISPSISTTGLGQKHFNQQFYWMDDYFIWRGML